MRAEAGPRLQLEVGEGKWQEEGSREMWCPTAFQSSSLDSFLIFITVLEAESY